MNFGKYSLDSYSESLVYKSSFGDIPSQYLYKSGINNINKLDVQKGYLEKAIGEWLQKSTGSSAITVPTVIDAEIQDHVRKEMPVVELINRRTNMGKIASYDYLSSRTAATFLSEANASGTSLTEQDDTYANGTATMKYSYAIGKITGVGQAADKHYVDLLSEVVRSKVLALKELHEEKFLSGDSSGTDEYDGLDQIITTNTTNMSGASIKLSDIGSSYDDSRTYGGTTKKLAVTDYTTLRTIKAQMQADVHYIDKTNIAWGLQTVQFEGMPIVPTRFSNDTSSNRRFYIVDTEVTEYRVLQEPTMVEMGILSDSKQFFIKEYSVPISKHEARCAMIYGLA